MYRTLVLAAFALAITAGSAAASKGSSIFSVGLGQGTADTYSSTSLGGTNDYLSPSTSPETNVGAEFWYLFSDDYAVAISGAYGLGNMKWESTGEPEVKATTSSVKFRIGGDRVGSVGDRMKVFMGPGIEIWTGKSKLEVGSTENESESVTRFGVSGRIGGIMMLTDNVGIQGQIGHTFGIASAEDGPAKSTWWPSSFNASWGLTFGFGGN
jgi:hypothetical protein